MAFSRERWLDEWMQKRHGGWNPVTRGDVLEILRDFQAALAPPQRRARCDCGATVAFPSHQPGCPLHAEYRAT